MKFFAISIALLSISAQAQTFTKLQPTATLSYGSSRVSGLSSIRAEGITVRNPQDSRSFFEFGGSVSAVFTSGKWIFGPVIGYEPIMGINLDKVYAGRRPTALYFESGKLTQTRLTKTSPYVGLFARLGDIEGQYTMQRFRLGERILSESNWGNWRVRTSGISHRFSGWYFPFAHQLGFGLYAEIAPAGIRSVGASVKADLTFKRR